MANFTEQNYKDLKKLERHLLTASRANYVTAIYRTTAEELTRIYNEVFSTSKKPTNCGKCVLDICKKLSVYYFQWKEAEGSKENATTDEKTTEVERVTEGTEKTPQKGKRGRKPKAKKTNDTDAK